MLEAIEEVLAWSAVFNHGLTEEEVHQHLAARATLEDVKAALETAATAVQTGGRWHPQRSILTWTSTKHGANLLTRTSKRWALCSRNWPPRRPSKR